MKEVFAVASAVAFAAVAVVAAPDYVEYRAKVGTTATVNLAVTNNPIGYVDEIYVQFPAGVRTALVTVVSMPNVGTSLPVTVLYSNATMQATAKARPRVTQTDNAGINLSSLTVAERFLSNGDKLVFRVRQAAGSTGVTFQCWCKIDK